VEILDGPRVVQRPEIRYVGIRRVTPFRGMLSQRDELLAQLFDWLGRNDAADAGPAFLRLHVIDMQGPMDLEVGAITEKPMTGDDRVRPGLLPAGRYATMTYRDHARRANGHLIEWAAANGHAFDRRDDPAGDLFACRYEAYRTDPRTEPRKTKWAVELNILLATRAA
jgi:effector-binding domain-containing protein